MATVTRHAAEGNAHAEPLSEASPPGKAEVDDGPVRLEEAQVVESAPGGGESGLALASDGARQHTIARLQRQQGNAYVQRVVRGATTSIQRAPPDAPPADAPAPATWQVPDLFGGGLLTNGGDASVELLKIKEQLAPLKDQFEGIPIVFTAVENLLPQTYGADASGPLSADLASKLSGVGLAAQGAYNVALSAFKVTLQQSLNIKEEHAAEFAEKAAEMLHATFTKDDSEAFEHAKEGFEQIHIYVEWAHYTNEWVVQALKICQSAERFEKIVEGLEGAGDWAGRGSAAIAALNTAVAAYSAITVSRDPNKTDTQKSVAQLKAGFSVVPLVTSVAVALGTLGASATGIGLLWTTMAPQIEQCFKMIEQLDERITEFYKVQSVDEWWDRARAEGTAGSAPQIDPKMADRFPGGQETLNFMWAVFRGSPPEKAPAPVEKYFYDTRKKMNEGHEGDDELDTEWHLFRANEVKNLIPWVQAHREEVWAMLYGTLTHP